MEMEKKLIKLYNIFNKRFKYLSSGRHRDVFISKTGKYVFKVPNCHSGICANDIEGSWFCDEYAHHKLFYINEIPIVIMEYLKEMDTETYLKLCKTEEYDWINGIDCGQVGYNRKGDVVAFDWEHC